MACPHLYHFWHILRPLLDLKLSVEYFLLCISGITVQVNMAAEILFLLGGLIYYAIFFAEVGLDRWKVYPVL